MRPKSMKDLKAGGETALNESQTQGNRRVRGLRDVMQSRKVAGRSVPATRSQQLSEIAWLDRELERLRREANILEANAARVNARIQEVVDRRESVMAVIRQDLGLYLAAAPAKPAGPKREEEDDEDSGVEEISLEY